MVHDTTKWFPAGASKFFALVASAQQQAPSRALKAGCASVHALALHWVKDGHLQLTLRSASGDVLSSGDGLSCALQASSRPASGSRTLAAARCQAPMHQGDRSGQGPLRELSSTGPETSGGRLQAPPAREGLPREASSACAACVRDPRLSEKP